MTVLIGAALLLLPLNTAWVFNPPLLFAGLNLTFATAVPFIVATLAARAYLAGGSAAALLLGCGMFAFGLGSGLAAVLAPFGQNVNITVHNVGAFLAGTCHVAGACLAASRFEGRGHLPSSVAILARCYCGIGLGIVVVALGSLDGLLPPFFIPGSGNTLLRQVVIEGAIVQFAGSGLLLWTGSGELRSAFHRWYALGLGLIALGLFAVVFVTRPGEPLSWTGRTAQYLGAIYALIAVLTVLRGYHAQGLSVGRTLAAFFTETHAQYRPLVESASDALISLDNAGTVLFWNAAAQSLFGLSAAEAFGRDLADIIVPADQAESVRHLVRILPRRSDGLVTGMHVERDLQARTGRVFPAEIGFLGRHTSRGNLTIAVLRDISERKQAEAALQQANSRLEQRVQERTAALEAAYAELRDVSQRLTYHVDNSPLAVIEWGPDMRLTRWSGAAERIFGWTPEEVLGKRIDEFRWVYDADQAQVNSVTADLRSGANPRRFSANRNYRKDGTVIHCEWYSSSLLDENGAVRSILSLVLDVTERVKAEAALQGVARFPDENPDPILRIGRDGVLLYANRQSELLLQMWGCEVGRPLPIDWCARVAEICTRGEPEEVEVACQGRVYSCILTPITTAGYLNLYGRDVTARKAAEEALRASEEQFRVLTQNLQSAVALIDERGAFSIVNDSFLRMFEIPAHADILNINRRDWSRWQVFDERGILLTVDEHPVRKAALTRTAVKDQLVAVKSPTSPDLKWLLVSAEPILDAQGGVCRLICTYYDITDRKAAEEALHQATDRYALLAETAEELLASPNPQAVVDALCGKVMKHLDCDVFFNFLVDDDQGRLRLNACAGIPADEAQKISWLDYGVAVCGCVARDRQRIVAEDIRTSADERTALVKSYGVQAYCCHPLRVGERLIGTLSFGTRRRARFTADEIELMRVVADQVAVAMERLRAEDGLKRAHDELERRVEGRTAELSAALHKVSSQSEQLRSLSSELTLAEQRERSRLAEMIHDGLQQLLVAAKLRLSVVGRAGDPVVKEASRDAIRSLDDAIADARSLTAELSPPVLRTGGLIAGLEWLARWSEEKHGLTVRIAAPTSAAPSLPEDLTVLLFQSVRELLFNVVKYAGVSEATVALVRQAESWMLKVTDAGAGFDPHRLRSEGGVAGGFGLARIRHRLELLGGCVNIASAPGEGTCVTLALPPATTDQSPTSSGDTKA